MIKKLILLVLPLLSLTSVSDGQAKTSIENHFKNDVAYYLDHFEDYQYSNWDFRYGDMINNYAMTYFAPSKGFFGTEAYNELCIDYVHTGANDLPIIVWKAPFSGKVSFDISAKLKYYNEQNQDGTAVVIYNNNKEEVYFQILDYTKVDEVYKYEDSFNIKKGEKIYFTVDLIGNNYFDNTDIDINIYLTDLTK